MRAGRKWSNKRAATSRMSTTSLLWLLLLLGGTIEAQQQLIYARDQRSLYGPPALGWNTVGGFSPIGLGHMTKDELLELLEAWQEVEGDIKPPAPEPVEPAAPPAMPPAPPPPPPRPAPPPAAPAPPPAPPAPLPGPVTVPRQPVNVRLPAFVPIQLSAMFTPPQAAGFGPGAEAGAAGEAAAGAAEETGSADRDMDMVAQSDENATPHLFRFMRRPLAAAQPRARSAQPQVVRNTLESVDAGVAPLTNFVLAKSANAAPRIQTDANPTLPAHPHQRPPVRPRYVLPPMHYMSNGPAPGSLELVPSSHIIGDWRE